MLIIVILTILLMYWGLFAEPTVVAVFAIPTILCTLVAHLIIEQGEKKTCVIGKKSKKQTK